MKKTTVLIPLLLSLLFCVTKLSAQDNGDAISPPNYSGGSINIFGDTVSFLRLDAGNAVFGNNDSVRGFRSFVFGDRNYIDRSVQVDFAFGTDNRMLGSYSFAIGRKNIVSTDRSFAMGQFLSLTDTSFVVGSGLASDARLANACSHGLTVGFLSTKPTITVTPSPNDYGHGVTDKTGKVAIGDVTPSAKLHIRSDPGEDATLFLQPAQLASNNSIIRLRDVNHSISVNSSGVMELSSGSLPFSIASDNLSVTGGLMKLGSLNDPKLVLNTGAIPGIFFNAMPTEGNPTRPSGTAAYAIQFGSDAMLLRTAVSHDPRDGDSDATNEVTSWTDALSIGNDGKVTINGKVGVNIDNTLADYDLAVNGGVIATAMRVKLDNEWPDYVFDEGRDPMPIDELDAYVAEYRHLPGMPSASEVKAEGIDLGRTQAAMLERVEELTLYVIALQHKVEELEKRISQDTVRFAYDACGNRTGRTITFSRDLEETPRNGQWLTEVTDDFGGAQATLSPNPTAGRFTLSLSDDTAVATTATLLTINGVVLETRTVDERHLTFDLSSQPSGIYLLRLSDNASSRTWKILKQ